MPSALAPTLSSKPPQRTPTRPEQWVLLTAAIFAVTGLLLQWWRIEVLQASYDQGIFLQVLWNGLHGHPFESTLSSQLSARVVHNEALPALGYHRLGQHFTPILALWIPLVGLLGPWALPLVQVGLITAAGLVLHRLALERLEPAPAALLACSFFMANTVIGPTWGNFTDLCQLPLLFFVLMLSLERHTGWLITLSALAIPLVREDTGVLLVGVAAWLLVRDRDRWPLAIGLGCLGAAWVVVVTTVLMPLFSDDNSRRFMVENFGQYVPGSEQATSLEVLREVVRQPLLLLQEAVSPPGETLRYLLGQGLPLLFVPLISLDSWLLMGLPLTALLVAQGENNPLSINIRYTLLVVPGLFSGAIMWWQTHGAWFHKRRVRQLWVAAMTLSLLFALTSNPHRSLSFAIPESVDPWIHRGPQRQWQHAQAARRQIAIIPPEASVAANTPLIHPLAQRTVLVRFPSSWRYLERNGQEQAVEWIAVDLDWMARYQAAFRGERSQLERSLKRLDRLQDEYGVRRLDDGVLLLQRGMSDEPQARKRWQQLRGELMNRLGEADRT